MLTDGAVEAALEGAVLQGEDGIEPGRLFQDVRIQRFQEAHIVDGGSYAVIGLVAPGGGQGVGAAGLRIGILALDAAGTCVTCLCLVSQSNTMT